VFRSAAPAAAVCIREEKDSAPTGGGAGAIEDGEEVDGEVVTSPAGLVGATVLDRGVGA